MIKISFPDGSIREYESGITGLEIAGNISSKLAKTAVAAKFGETLGDLLTPITTDTALEILTKDDESANEIIRHSTAHLLAFAVQKLYPGTKVTIGPVIKDGFYYDFDFPEGVSISDKDLPAIEKEMRRILKATHPFRRRVVSRDEAIKLFRDIGEDYKVEIIEALPADEEISIYDLGDGWFDLCAGPHVPSSKFLGVFKLTHIAGAYWRGDENNKQLTRIYGTAWKTQEDLDGHLHRLEEARKRDHRVLGKKLDLFSFHEEAPANAFFHARGTVVYNQLQNYMRKSNAEFGFEEINTPLVMNVDLWHRSGHYENYKENMYFVQVDEREAAIKPMNCPGHCLVYRSQKHSYRDLPLRFSEFGRVHRHERSGVTHGLFRVRTFVQDDAHIFCTPEQIEQEIAGVLKQIDTVYQHMGFENYRLELSTRPEKSIGSDEVWETAEAALKSVLEKSGRPWRLNPGDGAFYGPKIDCHLIDSLERSWQCGTVQLDFSMPERFGLEFIGSDDSKHTPVMIHRAVLGSMERFLGILIENFAGRFPLWLAPEQVRIVPISDRHSDYAQKVGDALADAGFRVHVDQRNERLNFKIREAQLFQVPYMAVIGDQEMDRQEISPRMVTGEQLESMSLISFIDRLTAEGGRGR
ncbi:MAG: threonine--tRNA ligase [Oligoflexus sp.]